MRHIPWILSEIICRNGSALLFIMVVLAVFISTGDRRLYFICHH